MLFANPDCIKLPLDLLRIWIHEANRVYRDKLIDLEDQQLMDRIIKELVRKQFDEQFLEAAMFHQPLLYSHFSLGIGDPKYSPVTSLAVSSRLRSKSLIL